MAVGVRGNFNEVERASNSPVICCERASPLLPKSRTLLSKSSSVTRWQRRQGDISGDRIASA
jgi:hypothetical protein